MARRTSTEPAKRGTRDPWRAGDVPPGERARGVSVGAALAVDLPDPDNKEWRSWPTANAAAALLEVTPMTVQKLWMTGEIARYRCPDNCYRFDPEQLAQYMQERAAAPDGYADPMRNPDVVMKAQEQAIRMLAQAQTHIQQLAQLYADPIQSALRMMQKANERLLERNESLETKLAEVADLREQMLQTMQDRELARVRHESAEKRKTEAWSTFMARLPQLMDQLQNTIAGSDPTTAQQVTDTMALLKSLNPELMQGLLEAELLDETQKTLVRRILDPALARPQNGAGQAEAGKEDAAAAAEGN